MLIFGGGQLKAEIGGRGKEEMLAFGRGLSMISTQLTSTYGRGQYGQMPSWRGKSKKEICRTGRDVWVGLVNMWERRVDDVDIRERQSQDMFEIPTQVGKMISKGTMEIFEMQQNRPELRMSAIIEGLVGEGTDPSCT